MEEAEKRTTNKELKEILDRLVGSTGDLAQHRSESTLRIHVLELEMARRVQFEASVNARLDRMPDQISKSIQDVINTHLVTCPLVNKGEKKVSDKDSPFGSWEWYRGRLDSILWAIIQASALIVAAKYFTGN